MVYGLVVWVYRTVLSTMSTTSTISLHEHGASEVDFSKVTKMSVASARDRRVAPVVTTEPRKLRRFMKVIPRLESGLSVETDYRERLRM